MNILNGINLLFEWVLGYNLNVLKCMKFYCMYKKLLDCEFGRY